MNDSNPDIKNYISVTAAYWVFMLTDGALRMLVLLHFHSLGFDAFKVAMLFLLYEFFGMVSNLVGGWVAAHSGLRSTLVSGLLLQVVALVMLSMMDSNWSITVSVVYVMLSQALSGIAKDLTKLSSKSAVKLLSASSKLFKWVAVLTGSKNAIKGAGFFAGGLMLSVLGFVYSLWLMAAVLVVVLVVAVPGLPNNMGQMKQKPGLSELWSKSRNINLLSIARLFLFGSRDIWFAVGLPLFLVSELQWTYAQAGSFMAVWIIGYGALQALTPWLFSTHVPAEKDAFVWVMLLCLTVSSILVLGKTAGLGDTVILPGLLVFALVFAVNSAIHSYLILSYSAHDDVTLNVGFYYMANAAGRLAGTFFSGLAYHWQGIWGCLAAAVLFIVISAITCSRLGRA